MRVLWPFFTAVAFALCSIPLNAGALLEFFESKSSSEKAQLIWSEISRSSYGNTIPQTVAPGFWDLLSLFSTAYTANAITHCGDFMLPGRKKIIHGSGTTARVEFLPEQDSPYTGIFSTGAEGIARLSLAVAPTEKFVPGLALKWFIDKKPSLNVMAMPYLDGQMEDNIFEHIYTTNVEAPEYSFKTWLLENRFASALGDAGQPDGNPRSFSLNHFASTTHMGAIVSHPFAPFELLFAPTMAIRDLYADQEQSDFRARLEGFGEGMILFQVFARHELQSTPTLIGNIVAKSNFVASSFGDNELFFKHPAMHRWSEFKNDGKSEL